jgi:PleD family two-component response regulator
VGGRRAADADRPGVMMQRFDEALYRAKNAGRNRVAV